jgi:hypothetical protein
MRDDELFHHLLQLPEPWHIERAQCDLKEEHVNVWVHHKPGVTWSCPVPGCDENAVASDYLKEQTWRHLDSCQFITYLHAKIPRVRCPVHGLQAAAIPWADLGSPFTRQFERLTVGIMAECRAGKRVAIRGLSPEDAQNIVTRATLRREARKKAGFRMNGGNEAVAVAAGARHSSELSHVSQYVMGDRSRGYGEGPSLVVKSSTRSSGNNRP